MLCKCEALSSNPHPTKTKKKLKEQRQSKDTIIPLSSSHPLLLFLRKLQNWVGNTKENYPRFLFFSFVSSPVLMKS
jgi:hypothetical protein